MMHFSKMQGLANDLMIIDAVTQHVFLTPDIIRSLSNRHSSIGFDQLVLVEPPCIPELDFHCRFFNADGNEVSQCGNGLRCVASFVRMKNLTNKLIIKISTQNRIIGLSVIDDNFIRVNMGEPDFDPQQVPFRSTQLEKTYIIHAAEHTLLCGVVSLGNPHCVIKVSDIKTAPVAIIGPLLEKHELFPERTNVGFMQIINPRHILLRVYERGTGETNSCGSGACAAVAIGILHELLEEQVAVEMLGGRLNISWLGIGSSIYMTGPAHHIYDGIIYKYIV